MDDEALLFRTTINGNVLAYDPWKIDRELARSLDGEPLHEVIAAARGEPQSDGTFKVLDEEASLDAIDRLLKASRAAFLLPPVVIDGSGVTDRAANRVLREFLAFCGAVKKNTASSATASAPTA